MKFEISNLKLLVVRSNTRTDLCPAGRPKASLPAVGGFVFVALLCVFAACFAGESQSEKPSDTKSNGNSKCYVCHPGLKTEEITTAHLDMDITCDQCHGPSIEHMHDEMLMTKPDLLFGRSEVNKLCSNPTCHRPTEDRIVYGRQDHKDPVVVEAFFKEWKGRTRSNGRAIMPNSVCTDCHGKHNLDKAITKLSEQESSAPWVAAFNGSDLTGWQPSGNASWTIKNSRIVGTAGADGKGGTLWSRDTYDDYLLAVTFRTTGPIHAGIWLRATDSQPGPRIEIFDPRCLFAQANCGGDPNALTGSVWMPKVGLVLVNWQEQLIDRESWNTISVKVAGDKIRVWLNGEEIGAVRTIASPKGKIGLHIENHPSSKDTQLCVREVLIHRLTALQEPTEKSAATEPNKPL
ncbi:MAG: DUF1080 domain-containing protein [Planctomycetota bacterium]|nr:DUF1080 domain-containing protein [Planctomycetota bacterium]